MAVTALAVAGGVQLAGQLLSFNSRRKAAAAQAKAAKLQYDLRQSQADEVLKRFRYNRVQQRLQATRLTGKQMVAFAQGGVTGRTPLSVIEDTIGTVEEALINKQIETEFDVNALRQQAEIDLIAQKTNAQAQSNAATFGLLQGLGQAVNNGIDINNAIKKGNN